jgi:type I restriction-modification system DNA methylase subunit/predicted type IV restriction endonuclease
MAAPNQVVELIERFERNRGAYMSGGYNETQLRNEFLNPLFEALGWDMLNKQGYAEAYKDVIHEDAIKVGGFTKAPDYCFRIGGTRKFFVEAKKPSVNVKDDTSPAFQLRRYAWSAKLPLSILSDFEEFAVYDCRIKPVKTDKSSTARILYTTFEKYPDKWDEIASVFARDSILKGSFDHYVETTKGKKGTAEVDAAFLKEIESWRDSLARNLALRNAGLSQRELNYAVQTLIDRLIFLRMCEDRGIEPYMRLLGQTNGHNVYGRLFELFQQADDRYNSGLFHFRDEKGRNEAADTLTPALKVDDKPLRDIIKNLYYPDSPYEFAVLPADILGQVYEQFLGKVIRLTAGHHAVVEDKPEVKKAGGVFYTPTYIVDYIVENTVGKLLEGKTPRQAVKLRILDPACGSGSFLIGAYQRLMDWHRDWYVEDGVGKHTKVIYQGPGGEWRLTTAERKRILLNNIYGVDIDSQAVEVTKLSLLLKVLEGESDETLTKQLQLFHERALPDLSENIKCGNSLIGPDLYDNQQLNLLDNEERYRINAFDWNSEFAPIMKAGGFDAAIGNPPYIRIQLMKELSPREVELYKNKYKSAGKGNYDIYVVFIEKALSVLNSNGRLGYIVPNKFVNSQYARPLREVLTDGKHVTEIVHFGANQIFTGATTYTCLLLLTAAPATEFVVRKVGDLDTWRQSGEAEIGTLASSVIDATEWVLPVGEGADIAQKLLHMPHKLGSMCDVFVGLQTSADDVYLLDLVSETDDILTLRSKALDKTWDFERGLFHPIVSGTDVKRYGPLPIRQYVLFPYDVTDDATELLDFKSIETSYPRTAEYLEINRERLEGREKGKAKGPKWYGYLYLKNLKRQTLVKACVPRLVDHLYATIDKEGNHYLDNVDVCGVVLKSDYRTQDLRYILALLNSTLLRWYFPMVSASFRGGWLSANKQFLSQLPLRLLDKSNEADSRYQAEIIRLVEEIFLLHERVQHTKTPLETDQIRRDIKMINDQIDMHVYELYGLTPRDIAIIEELEEQSI